MAKDFEEPTAEQIATFQTLSPEMQAKLAAINPEGAAAASYQLPDQDNAWGFGSPVYDPATGSYNTPGIVWNGTGPAPTDGEGIGDLFAGSPISPTGVTQRPDGSWVSDDNGIPVEVTDGYTGSDGSLTLGGNTGLPQVSTPWEGNPYQPVNAGGVQGIDPGGVPDWLESIQPDLTGYESSSNKDFYQKQMQEMRTAQHGQKLQDLAAAMRRQEASNAPPEQAFGGDPWSWTNLPEVQMGGTVAPTPIEWGYNPSYGITEGMTNQQAAGAVSPVLGANDLALLNKLWQDNPAAASGTNWVSAGSPTSAQTALSGGDTPRSPELNDVISKVLNNVYLQTGGGTGGIAVPEGYANPVNTQGV